MDSICDDDSNWKGLYMFGGAAALIMVAITLGQFIVFAVVTPPIEGSAIDWFALFQKNAFLGLLGFEFSLVIYAILSVLANLALFAALKPASPSLAVLFLVLSILGGMAFVAARPALEMLRLSSQYFASTTDAQKATFLAAGEAMVAVFHGTSFQVSYILGSISGFLIALAMLQGKVFSRATAYLRIGSSIFDFGLFIPGFGLYISLLSVFFLLAFNILIARRLFQLGSERVKAASN